MNVTDETKLEKKMFQKYFKMEQKILKKCFRCNIFFKHCDTTYWKKFTNLRVLCKTIE